MDFNLKKDRLSSLPDELIYQILSLFPTKDAAIVSLSSKKMRSVFLCLTTLDLDDSPISYCARKNPKLIERFQIFKTFVDNVLRGSQFPHLSKFRLGFGGDVNITYLHRYRWSIECGKHCFPDLEATKLNAWISFPLSRCGVREIDLCIHVREPGKLPPALFTCEKLEVLKLDTNLGFELVSSMPSFSFPNLKVLQLGSVIIPEDDFVGRLVSNCPLLQELEIACWWKCGKSVTISSPLLQKLVLLANRDLKYGDPGDLLNIDTPNLQYFVYKDKLALHSSVTRMKAPVQASICLYCDSGTAEGCFRSMLNLVRAVCSVQQLSLTCLEVLDYKDLETQLPIFHNLKCLEVDTDPRWKWDTVLFKFLMHSPVLEVLEFRKGIESWFAFQFESDPWIFRKNQVSPYCCMPHLKRIVIKKYTGTMREVEPVCFLLEHAPVLEELLIICQTKDEAAVLGKDIVDPALAESALKKLPRASSTCLITVQ